MNTYMEETFDVYTDNNPLTYVLTTAKLDATGQRWVAALANYNFDIYYRCGKTNANADALSRIPWRMFKIDEYGDTEQLVPIKQVVLDRCERRGDLFQYTSLGRGFAG